MTKWDSNQASITRSKDTVLNLTDTQWAYFAGIIDGEGYLDLLIHPDNGINGYCRREMRIVITGTGLEFLQEINSWFENDAKIYLHKRCKQAQDRGWRPLYSLRFRHNTIRTILPKILPYLILKRNHAVILKSALDLMREEPSEKREVKLLQLQLQLLNIKSQPGHRKKCHVKQDIIINALLEKHGLMVSQCENKEQVKEQNEITV
jgi:intein/homing endonuclease